MRYEVQLQKTTDVYENAASATTDDMGALHIHGEGGGKIAIYAAGTWTAVRETNSLTK